MKNLKLTFLSIILILIVSCQSETEKSDKTQPTTFVHFYMRFLQSDNQVKSTATFSRGMTQETSQPIKVEKGVFFYNSNMKENFLKDFGVRYTYDFKGSFSDKYLFRFIDPLKGNTEHKLNINSISSFSIEEISKSKGMKISWEGKPLNENETLVILINSEKNKLSTLEVKGKTDTPNITISPSKLSAIALGKLKIYLVRKQFQVTQKPNFVALSETEFYTNETEAVVVP